MRQLKITRSITNRENASLDRYLHEIGKVALITADEEVELARRIRQGDDVALERLTKANLRFVVSVAKQYQNQGLSLPDLINEGNLGLIKAAKRFDETRGFKFISYAVWWIRQSILQALAEQSRIVRLPLNQVGSVNRVRKISSYLEQELERKPLIDEIADKMDFSAKKVKTAIKISERHTSLDAPLREGEDMNMMDIYVSKDEKPTDYILMEESLKKEISRSLATLNPKEREVINMYFGIGVPHSFTFDEIGDKYGLSRERVRQIKEKALRKLKHEKRSHLLKKYLGA